MSMFKIALGIVFAMQSVLLFAPATAGAASQNVLIYQVMAGEESGATREFVTIYNNTDSDIDITGWCVGSKNVVQLACLPGSASERLFLPTHTAAKIASVPYAQAHPITNPTADRYDMTYSVASQSSGSIIGSADTIKLTNAEDVMVDSFEWTKLDAGMTWQRGEATPGVLKDTDTPADFSKSSNVAPAISYTYEVEVIWDICPNLPGTDAAIPPGYMQNQAGDCVVDVCPNLADLQEVVPSTYEKTSEGLCRLRVAPLAIVEILPNAKGADSGHEYIELFNPTSEMVDLSIYRLQIGVNADKAYEFPAESTIAPGEYKVFYDSDIPFSLVNTSGKVGLIAIDGTAVNVSDQYDAPGDDMAWVLLDGTWQYTDRPTPSGANLYMLDETATSGASGSSACGPGKYRHPLTNRCRNIESDAAVITNCEADQYRNPETGRCRKIATTASVTPCKEGQYRSEETNRCRNIVAAGSQAPCAEGQERNPDTNRCRNVLAKSVPDAAFAVQPVQEGMRAFVGWWALGGIGVLAAGYAGWEWRREIGTTLRKFSLKGLFRR